MLIDHDQHESLRRNANDFPVVTLSVDVEALPSRTAVPDKVGRLMWGNFDNGQMGVPRIIDLLDEAQVKATFFLEYLGALRYGKASVFEMGTYIRSRGQNLEVHAHPEVIPVGMTGGGTASWDAMDLETQTTVMQLTQQLYLENVGTPARIFRAGSLRFNSSTPHAARKAGYAALSNYFGDHYLQPNDYADMPGHFVWANGVQELTVSACLDEIIQCGPEWKARLDKLLAGRSSARHFFIHSWSMTRRDAKGCHDSFDDAYSDRFREILGYLNARCGMVGMQTAASLETTGCKIAPESIADSPDGRPKVNFEPVVSGYLRKRLFATNKAKSAIEVRYRESAAGGFQAQSAGNATSFAIEIRDAAGVASVPYEVSGTRAYLQISGQPICRHATEVFDALFRKHLGIDEIVFSDVFGRHVLKSPYVVGKYVGAASVLPLPASFERYRNLMVDKDLMDLIEAKERDLFENYRNVRVGFCGSAFDEQLTPAIFDELVGLVRRPMREQAEITGTPWADPLTEDWVTRHYPVYRNDGLCCYLEVDGKKVAAMISLMQGSTLEHVAAGHTERAAPGKRIGEILFLKAIEQFITLGGRLVRFNKRDAGSREWFGVTDEPLYSGTAHRRKPGQASTLPSDAVITALLEKGCNIRDIHVYLGVSAKRWIERTPSTPYAFDFTVDRFGPAPAGWRGWHVPIIDALHVTFDRLYQTYQPRALFDWNCCAGRNLIALAEYGLDKSGGMVFSSAALNATQANFTAANLPCPDLQSVSSPEAIPNLDLCGYDVFLAYHPSSESVFVELIARMKAASASSGQPIYLVYINCVHSQMLIQAGFTQIEAFEPHRNGWRFSDRAAIFIYDAISSS